MHIRKNKAIFNWKENYLKNYAHIFLEESKNSLESLLLKFFVFAGRRFLQLNRKGKKEGVINTPVSTLNLHFSLLIEYPQLTSPVYHFHPDPFFIICFVGTQTKMCFVLDYFLAIFSILPSYISLGFL